MHLGRNHTWDPPSPADASQARDYGSTGSMGLMRNGDSSRRDSMNVALAALNRK
jgi:hypothetical protein